MKSFEAWIFDTYPEAEGIRVWVLDREGFYRDFLDPWQPGLCVSGSKEALSRALACLRSKSHPVSVARVERRELFSGALRPVLEIRVPSAVHGGLVSELRRLGLSLYNADIHPVQVWHYERGHRNPRGALA